MIEYQQIVILLQNAPKKKQLATGTQFEVKDERIDNVYESILNGYKYLFINGGINDSVSGRATSNCVPVASHNTDPRPSNNTEAYVPL